MASLDCFNEWSRNLYVLSEDKPDRTSLYLSDVAVQSADELVNPSAREFNDKRRLERHLPHGWVVETLATVTDGVLDGSIPNHDVVLKPAGGTCGYDVQRVSGQRLNEALRSGSLGPLAYGEWIITRLYETHGYASAIWPGASNTIRLMTYTPDGSGPRFLAAVHKWGTPESGFVDNWSQGGLSTWIANGIMMGTMEDFSPVNERNGDGSTRAPLQYAPIRYRNHPSSGVLISGNEIPYWAEAQRMVLASAEIIADDIKYAGWDVIITPTGPVLIEANAWPGVQIIQVHAPLLGDQAFREFLEDSGVQGL